MGSDLLKLEELLMGSWSPRSSDIHNMNWCTASSPASVIENMKLKLATGTYFNNFPTVKGLNY
jgi:hypothetical protein